MGMKKYVRKRNRPYVLAGVMIFALAALLGPGSFNDLRAAGLTTIQLPENAEIEGAEILLGNIADIRGADLQFVQRLKNVQIGKAPQPGKSRQIDEQFLKLRLRQSDIDLAALQLIMPAPLTIARSYVEIKKEEIEQIISAYIDRNLPSDLGAAKITDIRVADRVVLPKGRITYKAELPGNAELAGTFPISVNFKVNEDFSKRIWATATIEILTAVVVAKKPIGRHQPFTEDDIELIKMDLAKLPANAIADPEMVLGRRSTRAINADTILNTDLIELPPLVKRGDMVVIVLESKGMKITALGQVKRKGRLGERIPVINFDSKKVLYAQVVDANTVKVEF